MKIKLLYILAILGILVGIISTFIYAEKLQPRKTLAASTNPFDNGVYATGIVESYQTNGSNINIYPEVPGRVEQVFVKDGQTLQINQPMLKIDDTLQQEAVAKDIADVKLQQANLVNVQDQLEKIQRSYAIDHNSISKNIMDNAVNAVNIAEDSVNVANAQYVLDKALLDKYIVRSPINGVVLRMSATPGDYISPTSGIYDSYTQLMLPPIQMGIIQPYMEVRCYLDEILVPRLPLGANLEASMFIRGMNEVSIPLQFVHIQPLTIPNIQLSNERSQRVDVRVLPIIFKFKKPVGINIFPGQLVDVYIKARK